MKFILNLIFIILPFVSFSQFGKYELYGYSRVGIGVGLTDLAYTTVLNGQNMGSPKSIKMNIGGGFTTEVGLGMKVLEKFYLEPFVSFMFSSKRYRTSESYESYVTQFSSNRFNIGLNGKYFVVISESMNLELYGGTSYRIPQDIIISTRYGEERIVYSSSVGIHGGFGGNFIRGNFVFNGGLRYRHEQYVLKTTQQLPVMFTQLNPQLNEIKISGIDIIFTVMYNF